ncbi:MAG: hypothetical protein JOS17DRAFT_727219 [Linnemannia elongata]|nr:MAG: hypothetical protein JOS17DRAFT_727219 [Linnemannia elongata]
MRFLALLLLLTLTAVLAFPTNLEMRTAPERRANQCRPSTFTWRVRFIGSADNKTVIQKHSFELLITKTYIGRITYSFPKVNQTILSHDGRFSVYHGEHLYKPLTFIYMGTEFNYQQPNTNVLAWEWAKYEYYACIDV